MLEEILSAHMPTLSTSSPSALGSGKAPGVHATRRASPTTSKLAHTLIADPPTVGLNSGAYRDTQSPQCVRRVPEASRQFVKYGLNGFDAHTHSTLPQKAKNEAIPSCLREQRAKRYGLVIIKGSSIFSCHYIIFSSYIRNIILYSSSYTSNIIL